MDRAIVPAVANPLTVPPSATAPTQGPPEGGAPLVGLDSPLTRTRGAATAKYYRHPTVGAAHARRVAFGNEWGAYNSQQAKKLRAAG